MKIRNKIKIACEGLHCLILLVMISPVRRALVGVAQWVERMAYILGRKTENYRRSEAFQNNEYVSNGVLEVVT